VQERWLQEHPQHRLVLAAAAAESTDANSDASEQSFLWRKQSCKHNSWIGSVVNH